MICSCATLGTSEKINRPVRVFVVVLLSDDAPFPVSNDGHVRGIVRQSFHPADLDALDSALCRHLSDG